MKHPEQRGPQTPRFERRYGADQFPAPRGVNTEKSGAEIDPNQFTRLVNVDWYGNEIRPRVSTGKCNDALIESDDTQVHPYDFRPGSPFRLWYYGLGCPGESAGLGHFIGMYSPEQFPFLQRLAWYQTAPLGIVTSLYGGQPMLAVENQLRQLQMIRVPYDGSEAMALAGGGSDVPLVDLPVGSHVKSMIEFDGYHFMAVDLGAGAGAIYAWDGRTLRLDLGGIAVPTALGLWRDSLIAGFVVGANHIRIRSRGTSPGTWTTVAPGAGTIETKVGQNAIVSHRDEAYLVTGSQGSGDVWKYNGTLLAIDHSPAGSLAVDAITEAFGLLYAGYRDGTAKLAVKSAGAWADNHKIFTGFTEVSGLSFYRSRLAAALYQAAQSSVALSPGSNTAGTYEVNAQAGIFSNRVESMVPM